MDHGAKTTQWKQWAASITATLTMICGGTVLGWATTTLPRLLHHDSPIPITPNQSSWIVSLTLIGILVAPIIGAIFADTFGRKSSLILTGFVYIVGWVITIFATTVSDLYVARIILGLGIGTAYTICPVYISEVADINIRGAVGTITVLNLLFGMVFSCIVGPFVSTKALTILLLTVPILFIVGFVWFPETPCYLASKGKNEAAARSLAFFRGIARIEDAKNDLEIVVKDMKQEGERSTWREKLRDMRMPCNRKALAIILSLITAQALSGAIVIQSYMGVLFRKTNVDMDPDIATLTVLVVSFFSCGAGMMLIERIGRRPLMMTSCLGTSANLLLLGTYLLLYKNEKKIQFLSWLPIVAINLSQVFFNVGLGVIPSVLVGELFPINVKSIASALMMVTSGLFSFIVTKLYQVVGDLLGDYVPYYFFAVSNLIAFVFTLVSVPETRNRPVREILDELADDRRMRSRRERFDLQHEVDLRE